MKSLGLRFGVLALGSLFAFAACGGDDDDDSTPNEPTAGAGHAGEPNSTGDAGAPSAYLCKVMGELCHEADTGSGAAHECHEVGHEGDAAACAKAFDGCIDTCVGDEAAGKPSACAALGELCHAVDDKDGPLHECHELGHVNDAAECATGFDHCAEICLAAREELEAEGEGGAGGAPSTGAPTSPGGAGGAGGAH